MLTFRLFAECLPLRSFSFLSFADCLFFSSFSFLAFGDDVSVDLFAGVWISVTQVPGKL